MSIKRKVFIPFILGLFIIGGVSLGSIFFLQEENIHKKAEEKLENTQEFFYSIINNDTKIFSTILHTLSNDTNIYKLFKEKKRDELFAYIKQNYKEYRDIYKISHLYFVEKNREVFLRVHNPKAYGDVVNRETMLEAQKKRSLSKGIEFGIHHNLTLRVVIPWVVDNKLIGYIELGEDIDKVVEKLDKILNIKGYLGFQKSLVEDKLSLWKQYIPKDSQIFSIHDYYILGDSLIESILEELQSFDFTNKLLHIDLKRNKFHIGQFIIEDLKNRDIGKLLILVDYTEDYFLLLRLIGFATAIIVLVSIVIILIYYRYSCKIHNELTASRKKLQEIAITDELTSLYNRREFNTIFSREFNRARREKTPLGFIVLDIDNFKKYNDTYGHKKGDEVLIQVAKEMQKNIKRAGDFIFRIGGEEFTVICSNVNKKETKQLATILKEAIENLKIPHSKNEEYGIVTISIGAISKIPDVDDSEDSFFNLADEKLYQVKKSGRNNILMAD